ncbi:hypothetical protein [Cumulibacter soli]|uniref:hypothetical protein n=1 Tax=Cumulibacter soli TaxID=2546344 RepID=UPI001FB8DF4E|nr:hypothetical protein [Cumulibacter soli]
MHRFIKLGGLVAAAVLALSACGDAPRKKAETHDEAVSKYPASIDLDEDYDPDAELAFAWPLEATSWDPHQGVSDYDLTYLFPVYDRLIGVSPDDEKVPMLATDWEVSDTAITLTLRDGVSFNDGTPSMPTPSKSTSIGPVRTMTARSRSNSPRSPTSRQWTSTP